jgi:protein-tyrosine-phosphatase
MNEPLPEFLKLLSHDLRWNLVKALTTSDYRVQELVGLLDQPMNLVSYHLKQLRDEAVVQTRRSDADGRDVYYSLDLERLRALYHAAGAALHPAFMADKLPDAGRQRQEKVRVLFVCTHNSARSQMAEGLMRHLAGGRVEVFSAGSDPRGIHPDTIQTMDTLGIDIQGQQSRHWHDFENQPFDYVITVCDRAREVCPTFPGGGQHLHWSFRDPLAVEDAGERARLFADTARQLETRIRYFLALTLE